MEKSCYFHGRTQAFHLDKTGWVFFTRDKIAHRKRMGEKNFSSESELWKWLFAAMYCRKELVDPGRALIIGSQKNNKEAIRLRCELPLKMGLMPASRQTLQIPNIRMLY